MPITPPLLTTNYPQSLNPSLTSLGGEGRDLQAVATPLCPYKEMGVARVESTAGGRGWRRWGRGLYLSGRGLGVGGVAGRDGRGRIHSLRGRGLTQRGRGSSL